MDPDLSWEPGTLRLDQTFLSSGYGTVTLCNLLEPPMLLEWRPLLVSGEFIATGFVLCNFVCDALNALFFLIPSQWYVFHWIGLLECLSWMDATLNRFYFGLSSRSSRVWCHILGVCTLLIDALGVILCILLGRMCWMIRDWWCWFLWDALLVAGHTMVARHLISPLRLEKV